MAEILSLYLLATTPFGEYFIVQDPRQAIILFPGATGTAFGTWNDLFEPYKELLIETKTNVYVYEPYDNIGFYKSFTEEMRVRAFLYDISKRGIPTVISGGSMGAWAALKYYRIADKRMFKGAYAVSPPINLANSYAAAVQTPGLAAIAARIENDTSTLFPFLVDIPNTAIIFGSDDSLIGTREDKDTLIRSMIDGGGFVMELEGIGHTNPELWSISALVSWTIRQCDSSSSLTEK